MALPWKTPETRLKGIQKAWKTQGILRIFFSLQQFLIFAKHHPTESRVTVPRQINLRADMIPFGAITYKDGERYVNESLFRSLGGGFAGFSRYFEALWIRS